MSIREHIACLEELSSLDQEIRRIEELLSQERDALSELKKELDRLDATIAADTESIGEMSKTRADLSVEVRQLATQVERSREKLSRARNEREQNAATRELEELRRIQKDREEEVGKLQVVESQAAKSREDAEASRAELMGKLSSSEGETTLKIDEVAALLSEKMETRKGLTKSLPRNILSRYDMIRQRRGTAIALTHDGTCLACHMQVPPQLFQKILRNEALELCPSCQRILYYKPRPKPEEA